MKGKPAIPLWFLDGLSPRRESRYGSIMGAGQSSIMGVAQSSTTSSPASSRTPNTATPGPSGQVPSTKE